MKPQLLCLALALCFLRCEVRADDPSDQKRSALQCFDSLMVNHAIASTDCAVFGQAEFVDTSKSAMGTLGIEWFQAKHQKDGYPVSYSETRYIYSLRGMNDAWEQYLIDGKDQYLIQGPLSRTMRPVEHVEDPVTHKIQYRLHPRMSAPNAFATAIMPHTSFTTHHDSDATVSNFLGNRLEFYSEGTDGDYVTGIWVTQKFYIQYTFDSASGYMPIKVLGFFANHEGQLQPGIADEQLFKNHAFTITTKWKKYDGKQPVYLPIQVVNTMHKLTASSENGREGQFKFAWKIKKMEDAEFKVAELNNRESTPKLRKLRDSLTDVFQKANAR